ncbi:MAG: hypothetical protein ABJZ92_05655 [Cyclobacteriaceae bacterium]|uniref:hypothetical protein n=1 Tax=Reichenbachiella sp. TaxID=2184521 RepID=UPI0032669251
MELAGTNKNELLRVLDYFNDDSLKYAAAMFLIENMDSHYSYYGPDLDKYDSYYEKLSNVWREKLTLSERNQIAKDLADSMGIFEIDLALKPDCQIITADFLIENIEFAFLSWENFSWSKKIDFNLFCETILPYKVLNEPIDKSWRRLAMQEFGWLKDSLNKEDLVSVANTIVYKTGSSIHYNAHLFGIPNAVSFRNINLGRLGKCDHFVTRTIYYLRAMGVPASFDYVPLWGTGDKGHSWISIKDEYGKLYAFDAFVNSDAIVNSDSIGFYGQIPKFKISQPRRAPKIYRFGYSIKQHRNISLPNNIVDVTNEYWPFPVDVTFDIETSSVKNVRLAVFNERSWKGLVEGTPLNESLWRFENIGKNIVYLPESMSTEIYNPFIIQNDGIVRNLNPDTINRQCITLTRKWPYTYRQQSAQEKMLGGMFQGSNHADFRTFRTIYTIFDRPEPRTNTYILDDSHSYRFYRFILPDETCKVAEIKFYGSNGKLLIGSLISSEHKSEKFNKNMVTDGNVLSYFVSEADSNGWVGIDLGSGFTDHLSKIEFYPPNDGNSIEIGDQYNLLYWNKGWQSLEQQIASKEYLVFDRVPTNALFILKNDTKGKQERIFTIENGKQIWW